MKKYVRHIYSHVEISDQIVHSVHVILGWFLFVFCTASLNHYFLSKVVELCMASLVINQTTVYICTLRWLSSLCFMTICTSVYSQCTVYTISLLESWSNMDVFGRVHYLKCFSSCPEMTLVSFLCPPHDQRDSCVRLLCVMTNTVWMNNIA